MRREADQNTYPSCYSDWGAGRLRALIVVLLLLLVLATLRAHDREDDVQDRANQLVLQDNLLLLLAQEADERQRLHADAARQILGGRNLVGNKRIRR